MSEYRDLGSAEIADVLEIQDVFARYTYLMDTKRLEEWFELFSADCTYIVHGREYQGREGVREMVALAAPEGTHLVAAPTIRVSGDHQVIQPIPQLAIRHTPRPGQHDGLHRPGGLLG